MIVTFGNLLIITYLYLLGFAVINRICMCVEKCMMMNHLPYSSKNDEKTDEK